MKQNCGGFVKIDKIFIKDLEAYFGKLFYTKDKKMKKLFKYIIGPSLGFYMINRFIKMKKV